MPSPAGKKEGWGTGATGGVGSPGGAWYRARAGWPLFLSSAPLTWHLDIKDLFSGQKTLMSPAHPVASAGPLLTPVEGQGRARRSKNEGSRSS